MLIQRAPEHISLFQKKVSWWSRLADFQTFLRRTAYAGMFGWLAARVAHYAFYVDYRHTLIGLVIALACLAITTYNAAIAGRLACRMAGL